MDKKLMIGIVIVVALVGGVAFILSSGSDLPEEVTLISDMGFSVNERDWISFKVDFPTYEGGNQHTIYSPVSEWDTFVDVVEACETIWANQGKSDLYRVHFDSETNVVWAYASTVGSSQQQYFLYQVAYYEIEVE